MGSMDYVRKWLFYDKAIETRPRLGYIDFKLQFSFDAVD